MGVFKIFCYGERKFYEFFKILLNFKNTEKVVKIGYFEKRLRWRAPIFFEIKEGYEVFCVKTLCYAKLLVGCYLYAI